MNQHQKTICQLVSSLNLSIQEVAQLIGSSPKSIYKWMNGTSLPNCKHILALLEAKENMHGHKKL